ncbi:type II glyceraldehyde-3-phosphate dehydrogenase [Halopenitus sp. POP-27]|uniref:type II glyceraldehyde-3-phosphate dehydrogenase n=1 Tax=Halopenitus sp. POP-27 TaxID=2994425 RepID=UPI00246860C0|nr:type II glyceraldehyde-3-phosphate dehydrogenase [Halopenitus sp. POP-27]
MIHVGVNGYGTIGKRVADAVAAQPDMTVSGVAKTRPNYEAETAVRRGYDLYAAIDDRADAFADAGLDVAGGLEELIEASDIVVDCCPSDIGAKNRPVYEDHGTPAIFQGGEGADIADVSFNARSNFEDARDADYVRVVSCNTTALSRVIAPLEEEYGIEKVRVTLVRRSGDPSETGRGPVNDVLPDPVSIPSHHGPDVNTIFPDVDIDTLALKAPTTLMHTHSLNVTLEAEPDEAAILDLLADESRIFTIPETADIDGAGKLKDYALDSGRPRGDLWENCVWAESVGMEGPDLYLFQNVHQESDVIPENIDAIRAMVTDVDAAASIERTNEALGVGLESLFDARGDREAVPIDD